MAKTALAGPFLLESPMPPKKPKPDSDNQLGLFGESAPEALAPAFKPVSKSEFIAGWQCDKYLWLDRHERRSRSVDPMSQFLMQQGSAVGKLAQGLFSDAKYEVEAVALGAMARADIVRRQNGKLLIYEVKSSGYDPENPYKENKEEYIWDLALQVYVFEGSGQAVDKAHLVLINKDFVKQGPIDPHLFFNIEDVTSQVRELLPRVEKALAHFKLILSQPQAPDVAIDTHCRSPHDCPWQERCYPVQGPGHIFKLRMLFWRDKFKLFHQGVTSITEYSGKLDSWQAKQVEVFKSQAPHIEKEAIQAFIAKLRYPLYHLDFETYNPAIPAFDGTRPNRQNVFQYSLHIQDSPGAAPRHFEYLPEHQGDPRRELLEKLLGELGESGSILAYYASFEIERLKELAIAFPEYESKIQAALKRFEDLEKPFSSGHYIHPQMEGKSSIKNVLPALVPSMTYKGMAVADGLGAIRAYAEILDAKTTEARRAELRKDLKAYCGQDTLAMVEILRVLESL